MVRTDDTVTIAYTRQPASDSCVNLRVVGNAGDYGFSASKTSLRCYDNQNNSDICGVFMVPPASSTGSRRVTFRFNDGVDISLKFYQNTKELKITTNIPGFTSEKTIATW